MVCKGQVIQITFSKQANKWLIVKMTVQLSALE